MTRPLALDLVDETTATAGTGPLTLLGNVSGYRSFEEVVGVGPSFYYRVRESQTVWELGAGHLSGTSTLVRDRVIASTNGGALVSFGAGIKEVFGAAPAELLSQARFVRHDGETPAGLVNGSNAVFTLAAAPDPPGSLALAVNGLLQRPGAGNDFLLSGLTVTFQAGAVPMAGDVLEAAYTA